MKPIRIEREELRSQAPWTPDEHVAQHQDTEHALDPQGAVVSHKTTHQFAAACGCLLAPAGFCSVCGQASCKRCFGHCATCGRPVCPRHAVRLGAGSVSLDTDAAGGVARLCEDCYANLRRRTLARRVVRGLLSFFVDLGPERGPRGGNS